MNPPTSRISYLLGGAVAVCVMSAALCLAALLMTPASIGAPGATSPEGGHGKVGGYDPLPQPTSTDVFLHQAVPGGPRDWRSAGAGSRQTADDGLTSIHWSFDDQNDAGANIYRNSGTVGAAADLVDNSAPNCAQEPGIFGTAIMCATNGSGSTNAPAWVSTFAPLLPAAQTVGNASDGGVNAISVSLWVWPRSFIGQNAGILGKQFFANGTWSSPFLSWSIQEIAGPNPTGVWLVNFDTVSYGPVSGGIQLDQQLTPSDGGFLALGLLQIGQWQLLSFVYESTAGSIVVYWDGQLVSSLGGVGGTGSAIAYGDAGGRFMVGGFPDGPPQSDMYYDDIRVEGTNRCPGTGDRRCPYYEAMTQHGLYGSTQ